MLTNSRIRQARPPAEGRIVLWDDGLAGFGVRVFASGKKSFIARYRLPGSRLMQTATIGTYGVITLVQARAKAQELLAKAKLGSDPQVERKVRAVGVKALTVAALIERYLRELRAGAVITSRSNGRPMAAAYIADTALQLGRFAAALGKRAAAGLARHDVVEVLAPYAQQPSVHRRMHGAIHRLYAWAQSRGLLDNAPAERIATTTAPARERVLTLKELAAIWQAADGLDPLYRDYVRLLLATGQRRTEVAGMSWGEVDLRRPVDAASGQDQGEAAAHHPATGAGCSDPQGPARGMSVSTGRRRSRAVLQQPRWQELGPHQRLGLAEAGARCSSHATALAAARLQAIAGYPLRRTGRRCRGARQPAQPRRQRHAGRHRRRLSEGHAPGAHAAGDAALEPALRERPQRHRQQGRATALKHG
jgi:hypothetical protein